MIERNMCENFPRDSFGQRCRCFAIEPSLVDSEDSIEMRTVLRITGKILCY